MSKRTTVVRSLHDIGLAAWFGGSLMGAVGLNGAAAQASDPTERLALAAVGWQRWSPVNATAIGSHLIGGVGLLLANRDRIKRQHGSRATVVAKTVLTGAALAATAYSGKLGRDANQQRHQPVAGATEPASGTADDAAQTQRRLQATQWLIPATTGALVMLGALQGEKQRPGAQLRGRLEHLRR